MPKTPTMTLPERVHEALRKKAKEEFEQEPSEYLRTFLITAATTTGALLKLELPPVMTSMDPAQPELPLAK